MTSSSFGSRTACHAVAMVLCIAMPTAVAAVSACDAPVAAVPLPDPALCLSRTGIAVPASAKAAAVEALFASAESRIAAGRFDDAGTALDCADAVLGADGDALSRYELVRRRGILDYRRERIPQALVRFECALAMARRREDRVAVARDLKNVGSALRRLGDFRGALDALTQSLRMQREAGEAGGMVLRNIADVYRELEEPAESMRFYREALDAFRSDGDRVEAGHTLETMSLLALDRGDTVQAQRWLEDALRSYRQADHYAYQLRAYAGLIRVALAQGKIAAAEAWRSAGLATAAEHDLPLPAPLQLQIARLDSLTGHAAAAELRLRSVIDALPGTDTDRAPLLEALANLQETRGNHADAVATHRRLRDAERKLDRAQYDRQLGWLRTRFETAERDRRIAALESSNRQRTLTLWLISVSALAALLTLSLLFLRWRQRTALAEVERRARHDEELARYRREADALTEDRNLLQALLDSRGEAVCLLDGDGVVLAANRSACLLLGSDRETLHGRPLAEAIDVPDEAALACALERMQDAESQTLDLLTGGAATRTLHAQLRHWEQGDGLIVVVLRNAQNGTDEPLNTAAEATMSAESGESAQRPGEDNEGTRQAFRRTLVELMLAAVDAWESTTGTTRLELAEKSRVWRVNIDDGRLRARVMERYLSLSKLPANPRWRDVVRTAYFVLGHCSLEAEGRAALKDGIDAVLAYTRRSALV
jgi:two-component system, sensor histidine kinase ChiS